MESTNTELQLSAQSLEGLQSVITISNDGNRKANAYYEANILPIIGKKQEDVTDAEIDMLKKFQSTCKTTSERMETTRKVYTREFDMAKKLFTDNEKAVADLQIRANSKVTEVATFRQRIIDEENTKLLRGKAVEEEKIRINAELTLQYKNSTLARISDRKGELYNEFSFCTLETIDAFAEKCKKLMNATSYETKSFLSKGALTTSKYAYHNAEELAEIEKSAREKQNAGCYKDYVESIQKYLSDELYPKIPAKRVEIEKHQAASREELQLLQAAENKRRNDELQQIANDMVSQLDAAQTEKELEVAAKTVDLYTAQVIPEGPKQISGVKNEVRVVVNSHAGWLEIIKYFWINGGAAQIPLDKMEIKALGSMRTYAQRMAMEGCETIDHPDVVYESIIKTTRK